MDTNCALDYCDRPKHCKGFCKAHYGQQARGRALTPIGSTYSAARTAAKRSGTKPCLVRGCARRDKVKGYCGPHYQMSRNYGVSAEEMATVLHKEVSCHVCGSTDRLVFDHDHKCCPQPHKNSKGVTCGECRRGILCNNCNTALGMVQDNVDLLTKMIDYLKPPLSA